ncbi:MAG TPA: glycine betaine ABC transporter substrate-binding protein [Longimicrobiaceae bacterium]|jgi:ABC-type proline/glycine betaine transport system substrate-binding protein|nr:glycine betaine ABC transporter substrate-binding protein [Longimicrobiaceae bacterium]
MFLTVGQLDIPSGEISGAIVQGVLERSGHHVRLVYGSYRELMDGFVGGSVDVLTAVFLPHAHAGWEQIRDHAVEVGALYSGARYVWSVPGYVPPALVESIADLARPNVQGRLARSVLAVRGTAGAALSASAVREYELAGLGYTVADETFSHWIRRCRTAAAAGEWFVIALPHPHFLHDECGLRVLADPLGVMGGEIRSAIVARREVAEAMPKSARDTLSRIRMDPDTLVDLETRMHETQGTPRATVRAWLDARPELLAEWRGAARD